MSYGYVMQGEEAILHVNALQNITRRDLQLPHLKYSPEVENERRADLAPARYESLNLLRDVPSRYYNDLCGRN